MDSFIYLISYSVKQSSSILVRINVPFYVMGFKNPLQWLTHPVLTTGGWSAANKTDI